jgi:acetyltransferase-like isoleucine patch superfamily enzyme
MAGSHASVPQHWPANIVAGAGTVITGDKAFDRFQSRQPDAIRVGRGTTLHAPHLALGGEGRLVIGDHCFFDNTIFLCDLEIRVGNYVVAGWNVTIADTDFHPASPQERLLDAIACSPTGDPAARPAIAKRAVVIHDDVWIGPNVTILKGVTIGAGARIEAGSVVTSDVGPGVYMIGNPARETACD